MASRLVAEMPCPLPPEQKNGHQSSCPSPYEFSSKCKFQCDEGYVLLPGDTDEVECVYATQGGSPPAARWNVIPTDCTGR